MSNIVRLDSSNKQKRLSTRESAMAIDVLRNQVAPSIAVLSGALNQAEEDIKVLAAAAAEQSMKLDHLQRCIETLAAFLVIDLPKLEPPPVPTATAAIATGAD